MYNYRFQTRRPRNTSQQSWWEGGILLQEERRVYPAQSSLKEGVGGPTEMGGIMRLSQPNKSGKGTPILMYCWVDCAGGSQGWNEDGPSLELPRNRGFPHLMKGGKGGVGEGAPVSI